MPYVVLNFKVYEETLDANELNASGKTIYTDFYSSIEFLVKMCLFGYKYENFIIFIKTC